MSIQAIAQVLDLELDDSPAKFVLIGLANHTNPAGQCFPSVRTLMRYTGLSESAVRACIKRLEEGGLIRVERRKHPENPKQNLTSLYFLTLPPSAGEGEGGTGETPPSPASTTTPGPAEEGRTVTNNRKRTASEGDARAMISEDWKPDDEVMEKIRLQYPKIDVDDQLTAFILKSRANQTIHGNPTEAFKGWMHRVKDLKLPPKAAATRARLVPAEPRAVASAIISDAEKMLRLKDILGWENKIIEAVAIYDRLGETEKSLSIWRQILEHGRPDGWHVEQAREKLKEE